MKFTIKVSCHPRPLKIFCVVICIVPKKIMTLQDALAELDADAKASGAYGLSTDRQLDTSRPHLPPPPGAELATVHVRYVG